jgi:membrane-associated phospholipid phosphatase
MLVGLVWATITLTPGADAAAQLPSPSFLRPSDAVFLGSAFALAATISLVDGRIAEELVEPGNKGPLRYLSFLGSSIGGPGPLACSTSLFALGYLTGHPELTSLGKWSLQAIAVSGVATLLLKGVVGRERPYAAGGDIDNYSFGRGFGSNRFASFPSGHTSAAFAVASVLERGTVDSRAHQLVAIVAYASATGIGLSRMVDNQHWTSDVVAGAALGFISGLAIVRRGRNAQSAHPLSGIAAGLRHLSVAADPRNGIGLRFDSGM